MSRIGNKPISVPAGVKVEIDGSHIKVTGPKGTLARDIRPEIGVSQKEGNLVLSTTDESKNNLAFKGMTRSLLSNMVTGVGDGFKRRLLIEGVGYRAELQGQVLVLSVGYSNPVRFDLPAGVKAEVDKTNAITLEAIDKELLGLTAARIRAVRKPEPYKGKGIRYEEEHIVRKVGKSGISG